MWVVILGSHLPYHSAACWGPFDEQAAAERFAAFITQEVDPAHVAKVRAPADELLTWRDTVALNTIKEPK